MVNVFIYGTFLDGDIVRGLTGKEFKSARALLYGYERFAVKNTAYPAIKPGINTSVEGGVLFDVDEESMAILRAFEGDAYELKELDVLVNNSVVHSVMFVYKEAYWNELEGEWNPQAFYQQYHSKYVDEVVPQFKANYQKK